MEPSWAITPEKVQAAIQKIIEVGRPRKLILFGSYVLGKVDLNSDLDILVITGDHVENFRNESIRIRRALKGIRMPFDILVVSQSKFGQLANMTGLIYQEAINNGKIVYESVE